MSSQKPTIDDVAKLAGVGRTTVSRVLNNGPNVSREIRERVRRAVELLEFKVNVQARNLAGGSSRQIALVHASDIDAEPNSFYHSALEIGVLRACASQGFFLVTHTVGQNGTSPEKRITALIDGDNCDGLILTPPFSDMLALVQDIRRRGCPVVCISAGPEVRQVAASVGIDDGEAGSEIARYLLGLGHRRFGYIKGLAGHVSAEGRFDGFARVLQSSGVAMSDVLVERGNFTFHSGISAAERLLSRADRPTALVCANDDMAAGALLTIHKMGIEIPGDVSVTGFDDTPVSEIVWPPLTTVHQPIKAMGQRAAEILVDAISGGNASAKPRLEVIDFRLVVRDSCAPPR